MRHRPSSTGQRRLATPLNCCLSLPLPHPCTAPILPLFTPVPPLPHPCPHSLRTACYGHIRDLLRVVTAAGSEAEGSAVPLYEVKRVAEFVSGKLCRAMLEAGKQHEAYDAFRRHTLLFKPLIHATPDRKPPQGAPPASVAAAGHLHWGWLGKQQHTNPDINPTPNPYPHPNPNPNSNPNPRQAAAQLREASRRGLRRARGRRRIGRPAAAAASRVAVRRARLLLPGGGELCPRAAPLRGAARRAGRGAADGGRRGGTAVAQHAISTSGAHGVAASGGGLEMRISHDLTRSPTDRPRFDETGGAISRRSSASSAREIPAGGTRSS